MLDSFRNTRKYKGPFMKELLFLSFFSSVIIANDTICIVKKDYTTPVTIDRLIYCNDGTSFSTLKHRQKNFFESFRKKGRIKNIAQRFFDEKKVQFSEELVTKRDSFSLYTTNGNRILKHCLVSLGQIYKQGLEKRVVQDAIISCNNEVSEIIYATPLEEIYDYLEGKNYQESFTFQENDKDVTTSNVVKYYSEDYKNARLARIKFVKRIFFTK